jgi:hypothetical protein
MFTILFETYISNQSIFEKQLAFVILLKVPFFSTFFMSNSDDIG